MCTVTYIPTNKGFVLTSNRDEKQHRKTLVPTKYDLNNKLTLYYPKDERAGGTWIAISNQHRIACLLNGAFENHEKKESYRKSRGEILIESFQYSSLQGFCDEINLTNIEPFTILLIDNTNTLLFKELVWDGKVKHIRSINASEYHIWSSATLYTLETRKKRISLFEQWIYNENIKTKSSIFQFHTKKHELATNENLIMKDENDLKTVSITQISCFDKRYNLEYHDLLSLEKTEIELLNEQKI